MPTYLDTWSIRSRKNVGQVTLLQKVKSFLEPAEAENTLVGGLDQTKMALYPDTSHWNGVVDCTKMVPYISAMMAKCSDGKQVIDGGINDLNTYKDDQFDHTVQTAWDAGIPTIAYHYWQPDHQPASEASRDRQFSALYNAINAKVGVAVRELRFDVEERSVTYPGTMKERLQTNYAWALKEWGDTIPITFYSSVNYMNTYPAIRDWLILASDPKEIQYAQWVFNTLTKATWAEVKNIYIPKLEMKVMNFVGWLAVQFTSKLYGMEGCNNGEIDLTLHKGTETELWRRLRWTGTPKPPEPPTPPPSGDYATKAELEAHKADKTAHTHTHITSAPIE